MTPQNINQLIATGESQQLEFKSSLNMREEIGETISAFANSTGGVILIGVSDDGTVRGVQMGKKTSEDLAHFIRNNTDPQMYPEIREHDRDGNTVIALSVKENDIKPVFFKGSPFQRVGKTNQRMSVTRIRELAQQQPIRVGWDEQVCEGATLTDIDQPLVSQFIKEANAKRNTSLNESATVKIVLRKLGLLKANHLTHGAVLLFGKEPQRFHSQAEVRCARFKGTEPVEFIDMKVFSGNLFSQIDEVEEFVKTHIALRAKIGGMKRQEQWEYPLEAIREAIVNALCHRDYASSGNVQIRIFDDRLEVRNPGGLPEGLTVEALKRDHDSFPRNRKIAECFFLVKLIERWGTGTNRMIRLCSDAGLPEPRFEDRKISFIVSLNQFFLTEDVLESLNDRQKNAIEFLKGTKRITTREYASRFGISHRMARIDIKQMIDLGILEKKGASDKTTYYVFSGNIAEI